ncbi:MAG: hypothetical protein HOE90_20390 [Bacteriovoracaceae bacterium]|jgi:hypothetical protein|nr:hypothetical protein [Bacteriovoracaceae bacterium]
MFNKLILLAFSSLYLSSAFAGFVKSEVKNFQLTADQLKGNVSFEKIYFDKDGVVFEYFPSKFDAKIVDDTIYHKNANFSVQYKLPTVFEDVLSINVDSLDFQTKPTTLSIGLDDLKMKFIKGTLAVENLNISSSDIRVSPFKRSWESTIYSLLYDLDANSTMLKLPMGLKFKIPGKRTPINLNTIEYINIKTIFGSTTVTGEIPGLFPIPIAAKFDTEYLGAKKQIKLTLNSFKISGFELRSIFLLQLKKAAIPGVEIIGSDIFIKLN